MTGLPILETPWRPQVGAYRAKDGINRRLLYGWSIGYHENGALMTREQTIERAKERYNGLLRAVASRWRGPLPFEDAYESAVTGLIRAVDTYDADRGPLSAWIHMHARKAVQTDALLYRQPDTVQYVDECTAPVCNDPAPTHGHLLRLLLNICGVTGNAADLLTECVLCNQSPAEAADTLGLSERSARAIYGNAVRVLKLRVTDEHPPSPTAPEGKHNAKSVLPDCEDTK